MADEVLGQDARAMTLATTAPMGRQMPASCCCVVGIMAAWVSLVVAIREGPGITGIDLKPPWLLVFLDLQVRIPGTLVELQVNRDR